ncbi:hypothetical protein G3578_10090 [Brevibacillus sp. SYP-B805]|uniref:phage tail assembly chaperone n=1 Tax=Brevibacillus sp. SYP-B805 TaxID=1578199 RepID=UPI0013EC1483|nr:hypothetical protein [Brevibacillus sp. SYP-B805]NGQ95502.1 hypothetical protein [Brevibacillus sp. SYP-B805]
MDALQALLGANVNLEKQVYIKRLGVHFTVKAIDGDTLTRIQERSTWYDGKGKNRTKVVDDQKMNMLIVAEGCVDPNFSDPRALEKYKASDAADCVKKALLAGEIAKLSNEILSLSGFDDDDSEEIKN